MDDKEKIKLILQIVTDGLINHQGLFYAPEEISSKLFEEFKCSNSWGLDEELNKFVSKYKNLFSLYGIETNTAAVNNPHIRYNNKAVNWMRGGEVI